MVARRSSLLAPQRREDLRLQAPKAIEYTAPIPYISHDYLFRDRIRAEGSYNWQWGGPRGHGIRQPCQIELQFRDAVCDGLWHRIMFILFVRLVMLEAGQRGPA